MPFATRHHHIRTIAILAVGALAASEAQQSSTLHGIVRDPLGALVQRAGVELLDEGRVVATTDTSSLGEYSFPLTATGRYSVRVSAATFQPTISKAEYLKASASAERKAISSSLKCKTRCGSFPGRR